MEGPTHGSLVLLQTWDESLVDDDHPLPGRKPSSCKRNEKMWGRMERGGFVGVKSVRKSTRKNKETKKTTRSKSLRVNPEQVITFNLVLCNNQAAQTQNSNNSPDFRSNI